MAEIPVTKKSGIPWWVWALIAAIILILLFVFLGGDDDADVAEVERDRVETVGMAGVITDLTTIERATVPTELAGDRVNIEGVRVDQVYGDRTFSVTDGAGATVFVVLDEVPPGTTPNDNVEGLVDVNAGQTVDITGELFEVTDGMIGGERIEDMPAGTNLYIYAETVAIEGAN